jgi:hypothetical protein
MHQSFLNEARYRYACLAGALGLCGLLAYGFDARHERPAGDTVLGFTLGGIAAALVLTLMAYGIRRRAFSASIGSTRAWLSMHVYFGLCVVLIATLHAGFNLGFDVHTLAYVLLGLVSLSGCWGVYAYLRYPALMSRERGALAREDLIARVAELDLIASRLARQSTGDLRDLILDAIARTRVGGGVWAQLCARDGSMVLIAPIRATGFSRLVSNRNQETLVDHLALLESASPSKLPHLQSLLKVSSEKAVLLRRLRRDIQMQGLLKIWLYAHVPLSFAMLAALLVHVFAVFYYF